MEEELQENEHAIDGTVKERSFSLGRFPAIDQRDRGFMLPKSLAVPVTKNYRHYMTAAPLDQDTTPQCVAYMWEMFLMAAPIKNKPWKTPAELYHEAQLVDEWAGENYEGTSVRAGAKVLQKQGLISSYLWAFDAETAARHILTTGPLALGTNWYEDMFDVDMASGFLKVSGNIAGGHAYLAKGFNRNKICPDGSLGAFRIINSWGANWGQKGMAWISFKDMDRLIKEWGEACTPTEIKVKVEAEG